MTSQVIIKLNTSGQPLVRVRDTLLFFSCWLMWAAIVLAFVNGCDWDTLSTSAQQWFLAHGAFLHSLLASFHIPAAYVAMMTMLASGFLLWSILNRLLAPSLRKQRMTPALTLEDIARHFHLDLALVDAMQKEKQILVFHAITGAVKELRRIQAPAMQTMLEA